MREGGSWSAYSIPRMCVCIVAQPRRRGHLPVVLSYLHSQTVPHQRNSRLSQFTHQAISRKTTNLVSQSSSSYCPPPLFTFSSYASLEQSSTSTMYTIFYMLCAIFLLLLLPSFLAPGVTKKQTNSKQFVGNFVRHNLKRKPCKEHRLRDNEMMLMLVTMLNIGVLISLCAMVNELLLRTSHFRRTDQEEGGPPSYEEATRRQPGFLHHSRSSFTTGGT